MLEFRLLGPVEVVVDGQPVRVGPPKRLAVLAALAMDAGRPVTVETLVDRVWGAEAAPANRATLYSHITRIRQLVADAAAASRSPAAVQRVPNGYVLRAEPDAIDLFRCRRLADLARDAPAGPARAALLRESLELWRGEPLSGVTGAWADRVRHALTDQRIALLAAWAADEIDVGRHDVVHEEMSAVLADHPLAEPLVAVQMRALFRGGRAAEALAQYATVRQRLADELGTEPGPELQRLHEAILRGGLEWRPAAAPPPAPHPAGVVPAQLPLDVFGFTGRLDELDRLDQIGRDSSAQPTTVVISAVSGTAGVGKTALAVHWAQRAAGRFPDGQLYVNLRGFDPSGAVMSPAEAIRGFLDAFQVPRDRIPAGLQAQVNLYRSLLAHKRALVVLDNARDAEQVRPLLPGAPGCMVLVTSRNRLAGLIAAEGAQPLHVDVLTVAEARQLLARRLGASRLDAEPDAVADLIVYCARLPLALAIVAARAATHPELPLSMLAAELRQARGDLAPFTGDDPATDVRAVFSCSYDMLSPAAARLFRLLGLHPGPDISGPAAASLAGAAPAAVTPLLFELTEAHLLTTPAPDRYNFHDLLCAYAGELVRQRDSDDERRAATHRMFDHYLHTAYACDRWISPLRGPIILPPPTADTTPEGVTTYEAALDWLTTEHAVLLATIRLAAAQGYDRRAAHLAWVLVTFFDRRGLWHDWVTTQHTALTCAQRVNDVTAQANAHRALGRAYIYLNRPADAEVHLKSALSKYSEVADHPGKAYAHLNVAILLGQQERHREALDHATQALRLFRRTQHRVGEALALNAVGWSHAQLGDHHQALRHCRRAVALLRQVGDRNNEAMTLDSLGYAYHQLGRHEEAIASYRRALAIYRQFHASFFAAETLQRLGDSYDATANAAGARHARGEARAILDDLGHPDAEQLRARLG
ncbi:tetratricopeptide repeat protein [Micromonospora sp. CPCC 205371]|nr:tetratricopeptide repeat protein [Micromonospora sp. CPCC 205371]